MLSTCSYPVLSPNSLKATLVLLTQIVWLCGYNLHFKDLQGTNLLV